MTRLPLREIWEGTFDEGERRMKRRSVGLASTGLVGGLDVMLGLTLVVVVTGAVAEVTSSIELAHVIGSTTFGVAFLFVVLGRSELFTENFLVPVGALLAGRCKRHEFVRMLAITFAFNLVGLALFSAILAIPDVLPEGAYEAAGDLADRFEARDLWASLGSALVAGAAMTLFTWLTIAATDNVTQALVALAIGFLLLAPVLNHSVVSFGEVLLALFAGTSEIGAWDLIWREAVAVAGNLIGGIGFVTATRLVQVTGEPHDTEHARGTRKS